MAVRGDYAYVAAYNELIVVNVSDPHHPVAIEYLSEWGRVGAVSVNGDHVYFGGNRLLDEELLRYARISTPSQPYKVGETLIGTETSGDVEAIAFHGEFAYVAGYHIGLKTVNIADPTRPFVVSAFHDIRGNDVALGDNYAYVANSNPYVPAGSESLAIVNIVDPPGPVQVGHHDALGSVTSAAVRSDYAYVTEKWSPGSDKSFHSELNVMNIGNPYNPEVMSFYYTPGDARHVIVNGSYAYVAAGESGLRLINISDPTHPVGEGFQYTPDEAKHVAVREDYAYVADGWYGGLRVIDVSDKTRLTEIGSIDTPRRAQSVVLSGDYAYVADEDSGLRVVNITDPVNLVEVGFYDTPGSAEGVAVRDGYAYVADGWDSGLRVIDVSDPTNPFEVGSHEIPNGSLNVALNGDYAYVANVLNGLRVLNISDPTNPVEVGF